MVFAPPLCLCISCLYNVLHGDFDKARIGQHSDMTTEFRVSVEILMDGLDYKYFTPTCGSNPTYSSILD